MISEVQQVRACPGSPLEAESIKPAAAKSVWPLKAPAAKERPNLLEGLDKAFRMEDHEYWVGDTLVHVSEKEQRHSYKEHIQGIKGSGGQGAVYEIKYPSGGGVVVKIEPYQGKTPDNLGYPSPPTFLAEFAQKHKQLLNYPKYFQKAEDIKKELAILQKLQQKLDNTEDVVKFMAASQGKYNLYIVFELCTGMNLDEVLHLDDKKYFDYFKPYMWKTSKKPDVPEEEWALWKNRNISQQISANIIKAVDKIHKIQIAHRDIKPGNIMVLSDARIVLIDFGMAMDVSKGAKSYTRAGTPYTMSFEVLRSKGKPYDPLKADYFSVGITIYIAFEKQNPVVCYKENSLAVKPGRTPNIIKQVNVGHSVSLAMEEGLKTLSKREFEKVKFEYEQHLKSGGNMANFNAHKKELLNCFSAHMGDLHETCYHLAAGAEFLWTKRTPENWREIITELSLRDPNQRLSVAGALDKLKGDPNSYKDTL